MHSLSIEENCSLVAQALIKTINLNNYARTNKNRAGKCKF